jgi:hypothetical protein
MRMPLIVAAGALVTLGTWLATRHHATPALGHAPGDCVAWLGTPPAEGDRAFIADEVLAVREAMLRARLSMYGEITREVAQQLFRHDHASGGWRAGIGLFYRWYLRHAAEALDEMDGTLIEIRPERPGARPWR